MKNIYYVEVNLLCIIILMLIRIQKHYRVQKLTESGRVFDHLLISTFVFCFTEMVSGIFRGAMFNGAIIILEVSNLAYFEALAFIGYFWLRYVWATLDQQRYQSRRMGFISLLPLLLFTIAAATNPSTHFLFSFDANNLYSRNIGTYFHWGVTWTYFLWAAATVVKVLFREKTKFKREVIFPYLYFLILPVIASLVQMFFYGVSSTQVGITLSIFMVSLANQNNQIDNDFLTGLFNRRGMDIYFENHIQHGKNQKLTIMMLDLDFFKMLNDRYGHSAGDSALKEVAEILRNVVSEQPEKIYTFRYGGDEFLIILETTDSTLVDDLLRQVNAALDARNSASMSTFKLSLSIGVASGLCDSEAAIQSLIHAADKAMYAQKQRLKEKQ